MSMPMKKLTSQILSFLENERIVRLKDYMDRGRTHKGIELGALKEDWVGVFRLFSCVPADEANRTRMHDLEAELALRSEELPWDVVQEEADNFIKMTDEAYRNMSAGRKAEANEELQEDLDRFIQETPQKKN